MAKFFGDDEWHNVAMETLPKHQQSSNAPVAVLKWMYALKSDVKINNVVKGYVFDCVVGREQLSYLMFHVFGLCGLDAAYFVGQTLVFTDGKP